MSDADLEFEEGKKEGMLDRLAAKLKKTRAELDALFEEFQRY